MRKPIASVTEAEFREFPLWRFAHGDDETWAAPIRNHTPGARASDLACVATDLMLADGSAVFGLISTPSGHREVDDQTTRVAVFVDGRRIDLAGYYDEATDGRLTPEAFANALSRQPEAVFPITYDVSQFFDGPTEKWRGKVFLKPPHPLSEDDLMDLIVSNLE